MSQRKQYNHAALRRDVLDAVSKLYADTSVPLETTLESLRSVQLHVETLVEAAEADLHCEPS